jgi:predicted RNA-binding protein
MHGNLEYGMVVKDYIFLEHTDEMVVKGDILHSYHGTCFK